MINMIFLLTLFKLLKENYIYISASIQLRNQLFYIQALNTFVDFFL